MQISDYFERTYEPFGLQLGNKIIYIITAPKDIAEIFKKPDILK